MIAIRPLMAEGYFSGPHDSLDCDAAIFACGGEEQRSERFIKAPASCDLLDSALNDIFNDPTFIHDSLYMTAVRASVERAQNE